VRILLVTIFFAILISPLYSSYDEQDILIKLLMTEINDKDEFVPPNKILRDGDFLICEGNGKITDCNNDAVEFMKAGNYDSAILKLEEGLKFAPLFFPFRYNVGLAYSRKMDFQKAFLHFNKARLVVPEYYLTYIQIGKTYELMNKFSDALTNYKTALKIYPDYLNSLVLIGNIYFKQKQKEISSQYYDQALVIDPYFPNAITGKVRILFDKEKYYQAYMLIKTIDIERDNTYDKSYHYYYAECAYKLLKYSEAYTQYGLLLKYRHDPFFLTSSIKVIEHKYNLSKRFAEELNEIQE